MYADLLHTGNNSDDNNTEDNHSVGNNHNAEGNRLEVYVTRHCRNCEFARKLSRFLDEEYTGLDVVIIDLEIAQATSRDAIPEEIFATPTYLLNGRVWSLGNPSPEKIVATFGPADSTVYPKWE